MNIAEEIRSATEIALEKIIQVAREQYEQAFQQGTERAYWRQAHLLEDLEEIARKYISSFEPGEDQVAIPLRAGDQTFDLMDALDAAEKGGAVTG